MLNIVVDMTRMRAFARGAEARAKDLTPAWRSIMAYADRNAQQTFRVLRHGGTFRGVTWPWFAPQYTRKGGHDGLGDRSTIPAEGGVRKVYGSGMVKGRKRPSGRRITKSSNLMRDTGRLRGLAGPKNTSKWRITKTSLTGTIRAPMAKKLNKQRPFWFWEARRDGKYIRDTVSRHIVLGRGSGSGATPIAGSLLGALRAQR